MSQKSTLLFVHCISCVTNGIYVWSMNHRRYRWTLPHVTMFSQLGYPVVHPVLHLVVPLVLHPGPRILNCNMSSVLQHTLGYFQSYPYRLRLRKHCELLISSLIVCWSYCVDNALALNDFMKPLGMSVAFDNNIVTCQRVGSPTNHLGSGQRQDTGPGILWSVHRWTT